MLRGQFGKSDQSSKPQAQRAQDERDQVLICSISNIYNGVKITPKTTTTTHQKCLPSVIMSKNAIDQLVLGYFALFFHKSSLISFPLLTLLLAMMLIELVDIVVGPQ